MKRLRVELGELAFAFENTSWEMSHYLDLETGQVITITNETRWKLESIYEETYDRESDQPVDLAEVLEEYDTPLATLGRKLQGHAQSFARGGDVFLADPQGHYLGRTCPWKRCGPGIRLRCDALHCGLLGTHGDQPVTIITALPLGSSFPGWVPSQLRGCL